MHIEMLSTSFRRLRVALKTGVLTRLAALLFRLASPDVQKQFDEAVNSRAAAEAHAGEFRAWVVRLRQDPFDGSRSSGAEGDLGSVGLLSPEAPMLTTNARNYEALVQTQRHVAEQMIYPLINHIGALWLKIGELQPTAIPPSGDSAHPG